MKLIVEIIGNSISTVKIEILIIKIEFLAYFGEKCFGISTFVPKSEFRCRNGNSDSEVEIRIGIQMQNRNRNQNSDFDIETEIEIPIWTSKF
jgi:hypothetical protein